MKPWVWVVTLFIGLTAVIGVVVVWTNLSAKQVDSKISSTKAMLEKMKIERSKKIDVLGRLQGIGFTPRLSRDSDFITDMAKADRNYAKCYPEAREEWTIPLEPEGSFFNGKWQQNAVLVFNDEDRLVGIYFLNKPPPAF